MLVAGAARSNHQHPYRGVPSARSCDLVRSHVCHVCTLGFPAPGSLTAEQRQKRPGAHSGTGLLLQTQWNRPSKYPSSRGIGRFRTPQLRIVVIGRSGRPAREPWHNQTKDGDSYVARTRIPLCSKGICATVTYRVVLTSREKLQRSGTCVRISDAKGRRSIRRRGQALCTFPVGFGLRR